MNAVVVDVLCVGTAAYDLTFSVAEHPAADEKLFARRLAMSGGGPAANAAVAACRLGHSAAFAGYLGQGPFGQLHLEELEREGVRTDLVARGSEMTPLSVALAKPDGRRALVNYKDGRDALPAGSVDFSPVRARVILFDGHEPHLSLPLARQARERGIPTLLDAGSLHEGTEALAGSVDYLVCAEKFAQEFCATADLDQALGELGRQAPAVVITLGERGLVWQRGQERGRLAAFPVEVVDTTGAGDAFHGAFAACLVEGLGWTEMLRFASAAGALCCTRLGARPGLPARSDVEELLRSRGA